MNEDGTLHAARTSPLARDSPSEALERRKSREAHPCPAARLAQEYRDGVFLRDVEALSI